MSSSYKSRFVSSVVFNGEYEVYIDFLVPFWRLNLILMPEVFERFVFIDLSKFEHDSCGPLVATISFIQSERMRLVPRDLEPVLVPWGGVVGPELGLVHHPREFLGTTSYALKTFPTL